MMGFFKGFKSGFKGFSHNITVVVNTVLLLVVYIVGVGLTSVFAKIVGKHFLGKGLKREVKTYWADLDLKKKPIEEYYRQF